jgi:hypothetical protein
MHSRGASVKPLDVLAFWKQRKAVESVDKQQKLNISGGLQQQQQQQQQQRRRLQRHRHRLLHYTLLSTGRRSGP